MWVRRIQLAWYGCKKQTHRSMEQNHEHRNKLTHIWLIDLRQRSQERTMGKGPSHQ